MDSENNDQGTGQPEFLIGQPKDTKWYKKKSTIILLILLLLLAGGLAAWMLLKKDATEPSKKPSSKAKTSDTVEAFPYFYLGADTKSISVYNPKTKAKTSIAISAGEGEALLSSSISSNKSVQISADGAVVAWATEKQTNCGEGGCEITDTHIYVKVGGETEQLVKVSQPQMIDDWLVSPDGKTVYYLVNQDSTKAAAYDLHKVTVADKKDTLVKKTVFDPATTNKTPMFAVGNNALRIYDNQAGIIEYRYDGTDVTTKKLAVDSFCDDCRVEYGQPLSPDGKKLILESGNTSGTFSYYLLDIDTITNKQIVKTAKTTEQLLGVYWSSDGTSIAYDITANGSAGQNDTSLKFRFEMYEIASGKTTVGFSDTSPGVNGPNYNNHFVTLLGWSLDDDYIALLNNDMVKIYDVAAADTADSGVATDSPISSNVGYGWYSR